MTYTVTCKAGDDVIKVVTSKTSVLLSGLSQLTRYEIKVEALENNGTLLVLSAEVYLTTSGELSWLMRLTELALGNRNKIMPDNPLSYFISAAYHTQHTCYKKAVLRGFSLVCFCKRALFTTMPCHKNQGVSTHLVDSTKQAVNYRSKGLFLNLVL